MATREQLLPRVTCNLHDEPRPVYCVTQIGEDNDYVTIVRYEEGVSGPMVDRTVVHMSELSVVAL